MKQLREAALDMIRNNPKLKSLDIYEFGIWQGRSAISMAKMLNSYGVRCNAMYGFDSFEGLPNYNDGDAWLPNERNSKLWDEKLFDLTTSRSVSDVVKWLQTKLEFSPSPMKFIPGYYEASLKDKLVTTYDMKPAAYVDIDVDLYKSTVLALDFLFRNKLIQVGALIGYHDWGGLQEYTGGESLAHKELTEKYCAVCEETFCRGKGLHVQKIFRVTTLG